MAEGGQGHRDVPPEPPGALDAAGLPGFRYAALHPELEVGSDPLTLVKWERTSDPTSPGVGRPAPQLETPRSQGGPSHIRLRP